MGTPITRRAIATGLMAGGIVASKAASSQPIAAPWTGAGQVRRAGGTLHYVTLGAGSASPPLVLLHKLGGWVADWRLVAPGLAAGRRVIAFDLPGHGDSRWDGAPPYIQSLAETAALIVGALDEMGIDRFDLAGNSLGGCVGVPLAAYWPERVRRLALVSCALGRAHTLAEIRVMIDQTHRSIGYTASGAPAPLTAQTLVHVFGTTHPERVLADMNASRALAGPWVAPSERGVAITDIVGLCARVASPTLLLYGRNNRDYLPFRAAAAAALKRSETAFVPDAGAFVMQDNPPATVAILDRFLREA